MQMMIPFLIALIVITGFVDSTMRTTSDFQVVAEATAIGDNMRAYMSYVRQYASANPAFTGNVPDAANPYLPTWYIRPTTVNNWVASGTAYVYNTAPPIGLAGYISKSGYYTLKVGVNSNGLLSGPMTYGVAPIAIPPGVPQNSVVLVQ